MNNFSQNAVSSAANQTTGATQQNFSSTQNTSGVNMQSIVTNAIPSQPLTIAAKTTNINTMLKNYAAHEASVTITLHQQLYSVLGEGHSLCVHLLNSANAADATQFKQHIKATTGKECPDDKVVATVLKQIFVGIDNKKAYTYRTVINYAIAKGVPAGGFVSFVNELDGLENARKAKYADDRLKQGVTQLQTRRLQTQTYVAQQPLSVVPESALQAALPNTAVGQQFVLVASRLDNGLIAFNAASVDDAALAAALRCVYKDAKDAIKSVVVPPANAAAQQTASTVQQPPTVMHTYMDASGNSITRPVDYVDAAIDALDEMPA